MFVSFFILFFFVKFCVATNIFGCSICDTDTVLYITDEQRCTQQVLGEYFFIFHIKLGENGMSVRPFNKYKYREQHKYTIGTMFRYKTDAYDMLWRSEHIKLNWRVKISLQTFIFVSLSNTKPKQLPFCTRDPASWIGTHFQN